MYSKNAITNPYLVDYTLTTSRHTVEIDAYNRFYAFDGNKTPFTVTQDPEFSSTIKIALFAGNFAGTYSNKASMKLYACKITDVGTLIRDYIPCKDPSGKVGVYDTVGQAFNGGVNTFTPGPAI